MYINESKIYITGYGIVSPLGIGKSENRENLYNEFCGISKHTLQYADRNVTSSFGVIHHDLPIDDFFLKENIIPDRVMTLSILAANEAVQQSCILNSELDPLKIGIVIGTSLGAIKSGDKFHSDWINNGIDATDVSTLKQYPLHAVADVVAKKYNFNGAKIVVSTACSSGANALGLASDLIRDGMCDIVISGGVDPIARFSFAGFTSLGAINENNCQPYSNSQGINIGEGSAFFVMESEESAKTRNAKKICEFRGYGLTADAYHPTAPDINGNGAVRSMNTAVKNSNISIREISYINGHGTGTPANDSAERKAWRNFVKDINEIPMISNKGAIGHCMGAAGAIEIAFSILSLKCGKVPPTLNFSSTQDEDINFVPNVALTKEVSNILSNSFAFGGNNCSVIIANGNNKEKSSTIEDDDVVITGIGCVGVGGNNVTEFFDTLSSGRNVISKLSVKDKDFNTPYVGKANVDNNFFKKFIQPSKLRRLDNITKLAMTSGRQALLDSKLTITPDNSSRIGVIYGTGTGPSGTIKTISEQIINIGISGVGSDLFPNSVLNAAPGQFSIANNLKGVTSTISSGNTSGINAIIYATLLLKSNQADAIVVISSDEWDETLHVGNERLGMLTTTGNLPFSENADGMILSEGSVAFVLERKKYAMLRNAKMYAKIENYFSVSNNPNLSEFDYSGNQWIEGFNRALKSSESNEIDLYIANSFGNKNLDKQEFELVEKLMPTSIVRSLPRCIGTPFGSIGTYALLSCIYSLTNNKASAIGDISDIAEIYKSRFLTSTKKCVKSAATSIASFGGSYAGIIVSTI